MAFVWKRNDRCEQPSLLAFVDTETTEVPNGNDSRVSHLYFRMGVLRIGSWDGANFTGVEETYLTRPHQFWDRIAERRGGKRVLWCFAHNVLFDLWILGFPELVESGAFRLMKPRPPVQQKGDKAAGSERGFRGFCSLEHGATFIKGIYRGKRINFVDTYNYFRGSVDSIGKSVGIPKEVVPHSDSPEKDWLGYCRQDVSIIQAATTELLREWKLTNSGNWQPTISGLAYSAYRHRFMHRPIVCHGDKDATSIEHSAYYDGRVSPFFRGVIGPTDTLFTVGSHGNGRRNGQALGGPVFHVDVDSLYPAVMRSHLFPCETIGESWGKPTIWPVESIDWLRERLETNLCVAICHIRTDKDWYPCRWRGRVIYPVGTFWTTLCTPEVQLALDSGHLIDCQAVILYHGHELFTSWVDYWWQRKRMAEQQGNLTQREVCKELLNNLVGKLAQRQRYWVNTDRYPPEERTWQSWAVYDHRRGPVSLRSIGRYVQEQVDAGWAQSALVATAAHVNSYARVRMLRDRMALPEKSVVYQANDALLLTDQGYLALCQSGQCGSGELGTYRLAGTYEQVSIHGPRDYVTDGRRVKAGLPKDAQEIGERRWSVRRIERGESLISRPPDGSVRVYADTVSGAEHHWGQYDPGDGWLRPVLLDL